MNVQAAGQLEAFFHPKNIAVIGAKETPKSVGQTVMNNLLAGGFTGSIFPVNPKRTAVCGVSCFPSVLHVPEDIDLAVIVVPASHVLEVMNECATKKVRAAVIVAAGFKEAGPEGAALEKAVIEVARTAGMRVIGPNCLGIMNPRHGLNASFASGMAKAGSLAFISQSGALCSAILDKSLSEGMGFSAFVSIGSMADVSWSDLIEYFGDDPTTKAITIYMETVGDPRSFVAAASSVSMRKPIVVIKPGRSNEAARAACSHTGSLTGSDDVFEAACERAGILRVRTTSELFGVATMLSTQPTPLGPRLLIITNAGGPAVLATDAAMSSGGQMAALSQTTISSLASFLPSAWSHSNPVDLLGDADPQRYGQAVAASITDPSVDGTLVVLTPQAMTDPTGTAAAIQKFSTMLQKPLIACWMGGARVSGGRRLLAEQGIPCFGFPEEASKSFEMVWNHSKKLRSRYASQRHRPLPSAAVIHARIATAREIIHKATEEGRLSLSEHEAKQIFSLYGIPIVETYVAKTADEAVRHATAIGFPVVLKIDSKTITHKSDIGGVALNVCSQEAVRNLFSSFKQRVAEEGGSAAFSGVTVQKMIDLKGVELIIGSSLDPQFGPVLLFGAGGVLVETLCDRALGLPPLSPAQARSMIETTRISSALKHVRGVGALPLEPIEDALLSLAELALELPEVRECDINPLLATSAGPLCLDARILLGFPPPDTAPACRPYPYEYVMQRADGTTIRPVRPEDSHRIATFLEKLSTQPENSSAVRGVTFASQPVEVVVAQLAYEPLNYFITLVAEEAEGEGSLIGLISLQKKTNQVIVLADQGSCSESVKQDLVTQLRTVAEREKGSMSRAIRAMAF